jgi:glutathione peroxidase
MFKILLLTFLATPPSIYSLSFRDSQGHVIPFNSFQGKKILLVNTASGSSRTGQYASLERLYQQYKDSLVIIAFPSNDFGHEAGSDSAIWQGVSRQFNIHFILAAKISVTGGARDPVYQWLTHSTLNGMKDNEVGDDFYKFLVDQSGHWIGVFSSMVDPMSNEMLNGIKN